METFSQCIYAWMEEKDISVSELAKRMGYKSKTTLFRLLHGESNLRSCEQFRDKLTPELTAAWKERFEQALRVERVGLQRSTQFQALDHAFLARKAPAYPGNQPSVHPSTALKGRVLLLGCTDEPAQRRIDALLADSPEIQITHYITEELLLSSPALLEGLIARLTDIRYQAVLLRGPEEQLRALPWNIALLSSPEQARIFLPGKDPAAWHLLQEEAVQAMQKNLDGLPQTPLYRYDTLESGSDYIRFTKAAYQLEHNRRAVILKPTPGMQMLPADVVEETFRDFLSSNFDAVVTSREALIYTFEKRVKNFYQRKQPTTLLLSADAMSAFAQTGMMSDQFYAFRSYTPKERIRILSALAALAEKEQVTLRLLPGPGYPLSFEAYKNQGTLIYPSNTCYNTRMEQYRELLLPGKQAFDLFNAYASDLARQVTLPDTLEGFSKLVQEAENSTTKK